MIYIVNRFTSSMLHAAKRGLVEIELSNLPLQAVKEMLIRGAKCYSMTVPFAQLLGKELGVALAITPGKFSPQSGDTVVHVNWHGPSIAGLDAFPTEGYLSARCLHFKKVL